jgi:hypothetical protein
MKKFLKVFEETAGNVSATCKQTGITRRTFYRWSDPRSSHRLHRLFQKRLARIRPIDVLLDAAELTIAQKIAQGDLKASMFVINKLGHRRGWTERPEALGAAQNEAGHSAQTAVKAYQMWLADNLNASESQKSEWLARFARTAGVPEDEMIRIMKVQELTSV